MDTKRCSYCLEEIGEQSYIHHDSPLGVHYFHAGHKYSGHCRRAAEYVKMGVGGTNVHYDPARMRGDGPALWIDESEYWLTTEETPLETPVTS